MNKRILNTSDLELRNLIIHLEEVGEIELADALKNDVVSAEQAHKLAYENLVETQRLDLEEEDFIPEEDTRDRAILNALDVILEDEEV